MSNLCYRLLDASRDASLYGSLRFAIFVLRRKWLPGDSTARVELDHLDDHAVHIGVFESGGSSLLGYVRLIQGGSGGLLMQQKEFSALLPSDDLGTSVVEVSRLCVAEVLPSGVTADEVVLQLYRAIYEFVQYHSVSALYATVEDVAAGIITKSTLEQLGFTPRTGPYQMEPNVDTYVMRLDLTDALIMRRVRSVLSL